jgi:hypothetical protein
MKAEQPLWECLLMIQRIREEGARTTNQWGRGWNVMSWMGVDCEHWVEEFPESSLEYLPA